MQFTPVGVVEKLLSESNDQFNGPCQIHFNPVEDQRFDTRLQLRLVGREVPVGIEKYFSNFVGKLWPQNVYLMLTYTDQVLATLY